MMMRIKAVLKKKLNSKAGFSLTEMLATVIILLLVSAIVAAGIPVARDAYEKVVLASNAEVLLSSTITSLRNELGTAKDVKADSNALIYYNLMRGGVANVAVGASGAASRISLSTENEPDIMLESYYNIYAEDAYAVHSSGATKLMSEKTATGDLYVTYETVDYDKDTGVVTFTNLSVNRRSGATDLAKRETLSIRVIAY